MGKQMSTAPKKKPAKPAKPALITVIIDAIKASKQKVKGASRTNIYKILGTTRPGTSVAAARRALAKAIESETLAYGATNSRFKLTDKARDLVKPKPKKEKKKAKRRTKKKRKRRK